MEKENFVKNISSSEARDLIEKHKNDENFVVLDVRTRPEFESGKIDDAINCDITDPLFEKSINNLEKNKTYFVYCRTGRRSKAAISFMRNLGFNKIYHLNEGIIEWNSSD